MKKLLLFMCNTRISYSVKNNQNLPLPQALHLLIWRACHVIWALDKKDPFQPNDLSTVHANSPPPPAYRLI